MARGERASAFKDFKKLVKSSRDFKRSLLRRVISERKVSAAYVNRLKKYLESFKNLRRKLGVGLDYEVEELKRDIIFLEKGRDSLFDYICTEHTGFMREVDKVCNRLKGSSFDVVYCDRDGTINNYAGRYYSSIQSVYNGLFLSNFLCRTKKFVLLSSVSLNKLRDVVLNRSPKITLAGSKGLEYLSGGKVVRYPIGKGNIARVDSLAKQLRKIISKPENNKFSLIGSGFQKKFGQISIARENISGSISKAESSRFFLEVKGIVDPKNFVVRDTGLDIEITLRKGKGDFTKKEGLDFVAKKVNGKRVLVCGDTVADLEMLKAKCASGATSIFVTKSREMKSKVSSIKGSIGVSSPDVLISVLDKFGREGNGRI